MYSKFPQVTIVFDRRKKATPTVKASVEIRICHNYKQKFISTGIRLNSTQWKNGRIVNCPDILQISKTLDKLLSDVRQVLYAMLDEGTLDISEVSRRLEMLYANKTDFLEYCNQRAVIRKYRKKKDSQERYDRFIRLFREWGKIKSFEDINERSIISYDLYLLKKGMKPYSKWNNYHRFLNSFIIDAVNDGLLRKNPYKWVNIEKEKNSSSINRCLTSFEFEQIRKAKMPTESMSKVRDLFVFQTYTCLRYSDLRAFDTKYIKEVKGMKVYVREAQKTKKPFTVPILSPAWSLLMKYHGKLPVISNVKYNLYLKNVAQAAGLDIKLTTHWARHTGATLLLNKGIDIRIIKKICGHSSTRITEQVYAKLLDETVVDAVAKLDI